MKLEPGVERPRGWKEYAVAILFIVVLAALAYAYKAFWQ
jgi:hypothetical protein